MICAEYELRAARRRVDDTPYGGGDGMLPMISNFRLLNAVKVAKALDPTVQSTDHDATRQIPYIVVPCAIAWWWFRRKDILS